MTVFINYGGGVNSTAILALICDGTLKYDNPVILFADTGAEKPETYEYVEYIQEKLAEYGYKLTIVQSKEGSLWSYCESKLILPMRRLRWCTDRWKKVPLQSYQNELNEGQLTRVIGIDYGEQHRIARWSGDKESVFPLVDLKLDRDGCKEVISKMGWKIPVKSGCFFCPYAGIDEFAILKKTNPELFNKVVNLEKKTLSRLKKNRMRGWFFEDMTIDKAVEKKRPDTCDGQAFLCHYCMT